MHLKLGITKADELNEIIRKISLSLLINPNVDFEPMVEMKLMKRRKKGGGEIRGTRLEERSAGNCGAIKFIEFKDTSLESGGNEFVV